MTTVRGTSGPVASEQAAGARCPLLLSHLETRNPQRRIVIADTARASRRSLSAYGALRGRFAFLGVPDDLSTGAADVPGGLSGALKRYGVRGQDLMLLWDLPNYVTADELPGLAGTARRWLRPGGLLHMLLASSQRRVASRPGHFEILPGWSGIVVQQDEPLREAPRFTPWQVEQAFQGFEIERSVLLRSGMQEYLLRLKMSATNQEESM